MPSYQAESSKSGKRQAAASGADASLCPLRYLHGSFSAMIAALCAAADAPIAINATSQAHLRRFHSCFVTRKANSSMSAGMHLESFAVWSLPFPKRPRVPPSVAKLTGECTASKWVTMTLLEALILMSHSGSFLTLINRKYLIFNGVTVSRPLARSMIPVGSVGSPIWDRRVTDDTTNREMADPDWLP